MVKLQNHSPLESPHYRMNIFHSIRLILLCLLLIISSRVTAQEYFKQLDESDKYLNQKIARFAGGDLLIVDSFLESQRTGKGGKLFATRIDPCGRIEWSYSFERTEEYLELRDVKINDSGEIFLYGSAYLGLDEMIFLLKLSDRGEVMVFNLYEPETVDHFTYNIDIQNNQLMAYGLLLDFNTRKLGFVAVFDHNLNFQWGKKFSPFESTGGAIFSSDRGIICRSGQFALKLDPAGELQWANSLAPGILPIAGPVEIPGGYLLEGYRDGLAFFYKLDQQGNLVWTTDKFLASKDGADIELLDDGRLFIIYNQPDVGRNYLCYLFLSPTGEILEQRKLNMSLSLQSGNVYQSIGRDNTITIAGNRDAFSTNSVDVNDFIMQFTLNAPPSDCFYWENFRDLTPNNSSLLFTPIDTTTAETTLRRQEAGKIASYPFDPPFREICELVPGQTLIQIDTTLSCEEDWLVSLPGPDFYWEDNSGENPRLLSKTGIYLAKSSSCDNTILYEYQLEKPACACPVFLPNAFSPNGDGINDRFELYSGCTIIAVQMQVYDRWGEKVFEGTSPDTFWDGNYAGQPVPSGIYVVKVNYQWQDDAYGPQEGSLIQEVLVVK